MSKITDMEEFLQHHGVKGMKWGQRRAQNKAVRKAYKADAKWARKVYSTGSAIERHNYIATRMNAEIPRLNARHPKANLVTSPNSAASKAYVKDYNKLAIKLNSEAIKAVDGHSPSGAKKVQISYDGDVPSLNIVDASVKHAATEEDLVLDLVISEGGMIIKVLPAKGEVKQSAVDEMDDFLEHYGVKGMQWGKRKRNPNAGFFRNRAKAAKKGPSPEELQKRKLQKIAKTSGTKALTNKELDQVTARLNKEKKYKELNPSTVKKGQNVAKAAVGTATFAASVYTLSKSPAAKAAGGAVKKAMK